MDTFSALLEGFSALLDLQTILLVLIGCALGMLTGVIPGFGPAAACSILLPITFVLDPVGGILMLLGIYYGAMFGGTITSVLLNVPGEVASIVTTFDGYQMAKRGRAGKALSIAAIGSFIGGLIALIGMLGATSLARFAITMGPLELLGLSVLGLTLVLSFAGRSLSKAVVSASLGLFIGVIGLDPFNGSERYTFAQPNLYGGLSFVAIVMGMFGVAEVLDTITRRVSKVKVDQNVGSLLVTRKEFAQSAGAIGRGTVIGFLFGLLPGSPVAAASFASYVTEKRLSKHPEEFGKGAIQGVAGPETANNALGISSMIPLLSFGIPASPTMAIILGAFLIHGLQPGPLLFRDHPEVGWTVIAGLFAANVVLLIMSLPLVRIWVKILRVPPKVLYPITLTFMLIGAYTLNNSVFEIVVMFVAGLVGLLFRRLHIPLAPAALTIVLGPLIEKNFRSAVSLQDGIEFGMLSSPLATTCFALTVLIFAWKATSHLPVVVEARTRIVSRLRREVRAPVDADPNTK
jgi:putative tricarboxylic transport membrane protein